MTRAGLVTVLVITVIGGAVFAIDPSLDLAIAGHFFSATKHSFISAPWLDGLRTAARFVVTLVAAPAFVAVVMKLIAPQRAMLIPGRAALLMIASLAIGPGLVSNVILKDHWHRPRPYQVAEFGGPLRFVPWWNPRGECRSNCSFVAGEPSGAFWTVAAASYAPLSWRPAAYATAVAFGIAVGVVRMAAGGHFASDVLFAGVLTILTIWLAHRAIYRWFGGWLTDDAIERAVASLVRRPQKPKEPDGPADRA
jgi:membrane-associated PAP2 superfamily phosphatase